MVESSIVAVADGVGINRREVLDYVNVGCSEISHHIKPGPAVLIGGVYNQRVAFPMAHRIAHEHLDVAAAARP